MLATALQRLQSASASASASPDTTVTAATTTVEVPGGTLAVTTCVSSASPSASATSAGPIILLLHGLGDTSATFRLLAPRLARDTRLLVVAPDLRGCGASSAKFPEYLPEQAGRDALAVVDQVAGSAAAAEQRGVVVLGHSYSAASAVWMAAERPSTVRGIVFAGPFVRDSARMTAGMRLLLHVLFAWPWGTAMWAMYYRDQLHKSPRLDRAELVTHTRSIQASLDTEHMHALRCMMFATKQACEQRLPEVRAPSLTVMGSADPDYTSPADEVAFITTALAHTGRAESVMIDQAGHYPFFEEPDETAKHIVAFVRSLLPSSQQQQQTQATQE